MLKTTHAGVGTSRRERAGLRLLALTFAVVIVSAMALGQGGTAPAGAARPLAQQPGTGAARPAPQQVDDLRDLVSMYVTVTDQKGNAIPGLRAGNFVVYEDDVEQETAEFLVDTSPISLGVVWGPNIPIGDTITAFLKASAPNTEFFLVGNDTVIAPFSTDLKKVPRVIAQNDMEIFPSGGRDAMRIGLDVLSEAAAYVRRVLLVAGRANRANPVNQPAFGNGTTYDSLANAAVRGGMQIYTLIIQGQASNPFAGLPASSIGNPSGIASAPGLGNQQQGLNNRGINAGLGGGQGFNNGINSSMADIDILGQNFQQTTDSIALDELAAMSGGLSYLLQNTDTGIGGNDTSELEAAADEIARGLRVQYRIGYHPTNSKRDGKWREIKVKLVDMPAEVPKKLRMWYKAGYYAPKEVVKKK